MALFPQNALVSKVAPCSETLTKPINPNLHKARTPPISRLICYIVPSLDETCFTVTQLSLAQSNVIFKDLTDEGRLLYPTKQAKTFIICVVAQPTDSSAKIQVGGSSKC